MLQKKKMQVIHAPPYLLCSPFWSKSNSFNFLTENSMAGSCEISNLISNYISAMYQPEEAPPDPDLLTHLVEDDNLSLVLSNANMATETTGSCP